MAFRVLILTDSPAFFERLEAAYDDVNMRLQLVPIELIKTEDVAPLGAHFEQEVVNLVVSALLNDGGETCIQVLADYCRSKGLPLIHLSSYRVFGGHQSGLNERLLPEPDDALGARLLACEEAALSANQAIVLRLPWMLTGEGDALLEAVVQGFLSNSPLIASEDAKGVLASWVDVVRTVVAMSQQVLAGAQAWGVFHLCSSDQSSEAEFADAIMRLLKAEGYNPSELITVKGEPRLVEREGLLEGHRCTDNFGIKQRSFRQGLRGYLQVWLDAQGYQSTPSQGIGAGATEGSNLL